MRLPFWLNRIVNPPAFPRYFAASAAAGAMSATAVTAAASARWRPCCDRLFLRYMSPPNLGCARRYAWRLGGASDRPLPARQSGRRQSAHPDGHGAILHATARGTPSDWEAQLRYGIVGLLVLIAVILLIAKVAVGGGILAVIAVIL